MSTPFKLFEAYGVELEYMIVDRDSLAVRPIADQVLIEDGEITSEIEDGVVGWSNELALHVIELKCAQPTPTLEGWGQHFAESLHRVLDRLAPLNATLLGTGMHPTMDPDTEFAKWPHEASEIYDAFDRIFDCRGHGWSNLQSMHLNLPFADDDELGRLHAAIRVILPVLPALCASSPIYGGRRQPSLDARLEVYKCNAKRVPEVSGQVIPEPAFTAAEYDAQVFQPLYRAIAPHDPKGILQHEWLNARGAIVRFDRNAIEIRVMDVQEHPVADLAIAATVSAVLKRLVDADQPTLRAFDSTRLRKTFDLCVEQADGAVLDDVELCRALGVDTKTPLKARELWHQLATETNTMTKPIEVITTEGTLARRIVDAVDRSSVEETYRALVDCLKEGRSFSAA